MRLPSPDPLILPVLLALLVGMVDVLAFLISGGFFASAMGGTIARGSVGVTLNWYDVQIALGAIIAFVVGVAGAAGLEARFARHSAAATLVMITGLIALPALLGAHERWWPLWSLAAAMGGGHRMLHQLAGGPPTVQLIALGEHLAHLLTHLRPSPAHRPVLILTGLIAGGLFAVGLYARLSWSTLWVAVAVAAGLAMVSWRTAPAEQQDNADQH